MAIKQQGGIFGRNPTFNNLTVDGQTTTTGIVSTKTGSASGDFVGYSYVRDVSSFSNGEIILGQTTNYQGVVSYEGQSGGNFYFDNTWNNANASIIFRHKTSATPVELGRFNSNGLVLPNGKGIDFSATSGTGTSELFSDYEEGDWTPVVADAASGGNEGTATVDARYTKVGNVVTVIATLNNIDTTGLTSGNVFYITGLPYPAYNLSTVGQIASGVALNNITFSGYVTATIQDAQNYMRFRQSTSGNQGEYLDVSNLNSSADIYFSHTYLT